MTDYTPAKPIVPGCKALTINVIETLQAEIADLEKANEEQDDRLEDYQHKFKIIKYTEDSYSTEQEVLGEIYDICEKVLLTPAAQSGEKE